MTMKSLMCVATLVLASFAIASAKSYDVVLYNPVKAGSIQLKAGDYSVKVKGDNAVFTAVGDGKTYTIPVKVDSDGPKHDSTAAVVDGLDGAAVLRSIKIGGSTVTLEFDK
jgi:hypothetical protein